MNGSADIEQSGYTRPHRAAAEEIAPTSGINARIAGLSGGTLLAIFMASLFMPMEIRVGARFTPYTLVLILTILPAAYHIFFVDRTNRFTVTDGFMVAYVLWIAIAVYHHYGASRAVFIVNQSITTLGGYVLARALIRDAEDYKLYFKYYFFGLLIFLPFALVELLTRQLIINDLVKSVVDSYPRAGQAPRLGLNRVQGFTPHSIHFGLFCTLGVANMFYIHRDAIMRRMSRTMAISFMTFISLSSAPNIAMLLQYFLIIWDRISGFIPLRWVVAVVVVAVVVTMVELTVENGMVGLVIENLAFSEQTGWGRTEIIEYGTAEVLRHPFFGLGLGGEWIRPWWRPASVDNFWLLTAMRYGAPALIFLLLGLGWQAVRLMTLPALSEQVAAYRTGYLIAWAGVSFVLATVHLWDAVAVLIMSYAGAGAWFYTSTTVRDAETARKLTAPQRMGQTAREARERQEAQYQRRTMGTETRKPSEPHQTGTRRSDLPDPAPLTRGRPGPKYTRGKKAPRHDT